MEDKSSNFPNGPGRDLPAPVTASPGKSARREAVITSTLFEVDDIEAATSELENRGYDLPVWYRPVEPSGPWPRAEPRLLHERR